MTRIAPFDPQEQLGVILSINDDYKNTIEEIINLVGEGADLNTPITLAGKSLTPLEIAASHNSNIVVRFLIESGAAITANAITLAAYCKREDNVYAIVSTAVKNDLPPEEEIFNGLNSVKGLLSKETLNKISNLFPQDSQKTESVSSDSSPTKTIDSPEAVKPYSPQTIKASSPEPAELVKESPNNSPQKSNQNKFSVRKFFSACLPSYYLR